MFRKSGNGRKRDSENRQPALEGLEPRVLLSGNVHAVVVAGVLNITGDDLDNGIQIQQGVAPGLFDITSVGLPATTIDNEHVIGVTGDIIIQMGGGHDVVNLVKSVCPKNVVIDGGPGANEIYLSGLVVKGGLTITNGAGNDTVNVGGVVLGGASIDNGDGDNSAAVSASIWGGLTVVNGNAAVNPNGTTLDAADIRGVTRITNGNGGSTVIAANAALRGNLILSSGTGQNNFTLSSGIAAGIQITNGPGGSQTTLRQSTVTGNVALQNGDGLNTFNLTSGSCGSIVINNHSGNGSTSLQTGIVKGSVTVTNGDGDGAFSAQAGTAIAKNVALTNGTGTNSFNLDQSSCGSVAINNFAGNSNAFVTTSKVKGSMAVKNGNGNGTFIVVPAPSPATSR
jgi:hypothetical protein